MTTSGLQTPPAATASPASFVAATSASTRCSATTRRRSAVSSSPGSAAMAASSGCTLTASCRASSGPADRTYRKARAMRGVVYDGNDYQVVDDLSVRDPGPGEVAVRIEAAGVCHSDVSVI